MGSKELTPRELMQAAMRRQPTPRIPTMPQITLDMPIRVYASHYGGDWIDGMKRILEDPAWEYKYVTRLVEEVNCDGIRLFLKPAAVKIERVKDDLFAYDPQTGDRLGKINTMGGGNLIPDHPLPPIETLEEAKKRLDKQVEEATDEKIAMIKAARERVPHRFAASSPGHITMDGYIALRGLEQSMMDLFERPDFVAAVMDLQAEAAIQVAEKLIPTGIDTLYIGDPSASPSLINPKHFEKYCLPAYQKFCNHFKDRDILVYIHICGNSSLILEVLAESGVDVVEPLDPMGGVSVADAKQRIGDRVGLMGGVSTNSLAENTPEEVRAEAIQKCREGGPYGFVLAAGCGVPAVTPLENLQAMVDVATKSLWKE